MTLGLRPCYSWYLVVTDLQHIAVIMDGNRRWAKQRGLSSMHGHKAGVDALKNLVKICPDFGIKYLTVYAFSTENWKRAAVERDFIFKLLEDVALKELDGLHANGVRVSFWGDLSPFASTHLLSVIQKLEKATANNSKLNLQIALNYGAQTEIHQAFQKSVLSNQDFRDFESHLYSAGCPNPDILIRTGGQHRLSNFLLWQCVDSYISFIDRFWPDFSREDLELVIQKFSNSKQKVLAGA